MLELSPKLLATKDMYALLKTIVKEEYMPAKFEDFKASFKEARVDRVDDPYTITVVPFAYVASKENFRVKSLSMLFFPNGIGWFGDMSKEVLIEDKANLRDLVHIKMQRLLGEKCKDIEYFQYLLRKNRYTLELFDDEVKANRPCFFKFKARKAYDEEMKKQREELETAYDEHMEFVQLKIIDLTREQENKKKKK